MTKIYLSLISLLIATQIFSQNLFVQDFGTLAAADYTTAGVSESFISSTPSGGGTYRVRVGTGAGGFSLGNYGYAGSGTEFRLTAPSTGSANKFSVYDYANATSFSSLKFDLVATGTNGVFYFLNGDGATFSDNNTFNATHTFASISCTLTAAGVATVQYHNGTAWVTLGGGFLPTGTANKVTIELYCNNGTTATSYQRPSDASTYSLGAGKWDVWASGTLLVDENPKSSLAAGGNIDSWMMYAVSSAGNAGVAYIDNISYANSASITLPVKLKSFTAKKIENNVQLKWATSSEVNTEKFLVEKSLNGKDFESIATIKASNNVAGSEYSFIDRKGIAAINYYRLKMIDKDGKIEYSPIVAVSEKSKAQFELLGNPVKEQLVVRLQSSEAGSITVTDVLGRILTTKNIQEPTGNFYIDISKLNAGNYFVNFKTSISSKSLQFIKE